MWEGTVVSIHIAPTASAPMQSVPEACAMPGRGLKGDRYFAGTGYYSNKPSNGGRELTLIDVATLEAVSRAAPDTAGQPPAITLTANEARRNIATAGVPLNDLVGPVFSVGAVLMRGTRLCEPCQYLERLTQPGVMRALVHRGGLRAQILSEGIVRVGDAVRLTGA